MLRQAPASQAAWPSEPQSAARAAGREIPYDYVAKFKLTGERGNRVLDVINVSVDGPFVAVSIGYSFVPATSYWDSMMRVFQTMTAVSKTNSTLVQLASQQNMDPSQLQRMISQTLTSTMMTDPRYRNIDFYYSLVDSGSGREMQNQKVHNIAGLGNALGDRPFRMLPRPMTFLPRSTIRIEVEEISEGYTRDGELFMVLHGYKVLTS